MQDKTRDETRWLARLLSIIFVMLAVRILIIMYQRFTGESLTPLAGALSLGVSALFFWLGYWLWTCRSLWDMFNWMPEPLPSFLYLQAQYFRINRHVRSGLVGSVSVLILQGVIYISVVLNKEDGFWHWLSRIWIRLFWPHREWVEILNFSRWPILAQFLFVLFYLFMMGFAIGLLLSWMKARIWQAPKPDELE